ncbi:dinucleotide-binding protein [Levilactobacillus senmaizukei DSM 21775 = NBRC 103853]|uniref:Dinucleotide-binding protein n=1 Tax=Levilactobacillus senmaizukei DSM 21775 = NBRC 103853 TaxID=1423803 RepID=A0A0R2DCF1_9LACO|nr:NAD(P)-binding domain-containing protein [Levilactobacillus senmaizukei]KRN01489.1 dinucleotide-binding protein [Levilactobacillus senmaizukei DSM 21775 = NBRC 103853]
MAAITIFGKGNMGSAIGDVFTQGGNQVSFIDSNDPVENLGDIVVLAVPFNAALSIAKANKAALAGKVVVDITNPLNFETWDELVVPADSSAAAEIAAILPDSKVVKAFNTTFAATLQSRKVSDDVQTTVMAAGDDAAAKDQLAAALTDSGVAFVDAGSLKRARELESFGFLQMTLAANEKIGWTGGFGVLK